MTTEHKISVAIDGYRMKNGRNWKSKLKEDWFSNTNHDPFLQQFRNRYGFDILDKIKYHTTKREILEILAAQNA
jgi:hypothetical protein